MGFLVSPQAEPRSRDFSYGWASLGGLLGEAASLLLLRVLARRRAVPPGLVFPAIDGEGHLGTATYRQPVGSAEVEVLVLERALRTKEGVPVVGCPVLAVLQDEAVLGERGTERGWGLFGGAGGGTHEVPCLLRAAQPQPQPALPEQPLDWEEDAQLHSWFLDRKVRGGPWGWQDPHGGAHLVPLPCRRSCGRPTAAPRGSTPSWPPSWPISCRRCCSGSPPTPSPSPPPSSPPSPAGSPPAPASPPPAAPKPRLPRNKAVRAAPQPGLECFVGKPRHGGGWAGGCAAPGAVWGTLLPLRPHPRPSRDRAPPVPSPGPGTPSPCPLPQHQEAAGPRRT
ncbi:Ciliogenesis-associated TTC17-interacting protein [Aix galericulata]|nr:Ciliogenesis-associated TTC17-interacting protein [Aix galericulata]